MSFLKGISLLNVVFELKFLNVFMGQEDPIESPSRLLNGYQGSFPQYRQLRHEIDHSRPSRAEDECNYNSTPQYALMVSTNPNVPLQLLLHYDVLCYFTKTICMCVTELPLNRVTICECW